MMILPSAPRNRLLLLLLICSGVAGLRAQNVAQQLGFAGLRSVAQQGQINAVKTDAAGNVYLLLNQGDGVRLLKVDAAETTVLAQTQVGSKGDIGLAMAMDPAGNLYVAGTSTGSLAATSGAAISARTDSSTQSFVARYDAGLNNIFVTFTGGSKIAAAAVAATADSVFVTGVTYATNLPVTATAVQQTTAPGSFGNGFVERFSASGTTLVYASYLTGANGDTTPTGIAADSGDASYVVGSTSASGFPTVAALVPAMLGNPSGFLTKLTAAGDAITFSTFLPGSGLTSIALDQTAQNLLVAGNVSLGQFPVDTVASPIAAGLSYESVVTIPVSGNAVANGTLLLPGSSAFVAPDNAGGVWVDGTLTAAVFPFAPLAEAGNGFAVHVTAAHALDQTVRLGGVANGNPTFASVPAVPTSVAVDAAGNALLAGALQPTASASLLATETYDVPLRNAPTAAFPSSVASAEQTAATCNGSLCAGSAAYLERVSTAASGSALAFSVGDLPFVVLRNLGSAAATGLQLATTAGTLTTNCGTALAAGGVCNILLSGGAAGTLNATAAGDTQAVAFGAYAASAGTIAFYPKELDFGIVSAAGAQARRTITVTNLGTASQTFRSAIDSSATTDSPYTEVASDCTLAGAVTTKLLAPGGTCHITLGFAPSTSASGDGYSTGQWSIGGRDVALTAYSQAGALSVSATEVDFGTQFAGGSALRLPRYLYLSNASTGAVTHAALTLPAGSPFTLTDGCPATIVAGSVCRIRIDYLSAAVPSSDSVTLTLDAGLSTLLTGRTLPPQGVTGSTANPNLSVTPLSLTFQTPVAVTSTGGETQTVTILNTGAAPFALTLALTGDFISNTSCTATLAGGASCAVAITLAPSEPGVRTGLLAVTAGAGTSPVYVSLTGTGTAILPANNGTLTFGTTPVGQPEVQFYKVQQAFNPLTATATGPYAVAFVIDNGFTPATPPVSAFSTSVTGNCPSCYLAVEFLPTATGVQTGSLTLTSAAAGNAYVLALTGSGGTTTGLLLTPSAQDFGSVAVHSTSGAVVLTMTNNDAAGNAVTLTNPVLTGDYGFVAASTGAQACGGALAFGASCEVVVAAAPKATGTRAGTLTFSSGTSSVAAALTVVGAADPGLAINPVGLTFQNVPGATATTQTVTLTNTGSAALAIAAAATSAGFGVTSSCGTLAAGASCTLTVTYMPGVAPVSGSLSFTASGAAYLVALNGSYAAAGAGLELVPGVANFGPVAVGVESPVRVFTLNNLTTAAQTVSVLIPRQFVLVGSPCTMVAAGGACNFSAAFLPLDNGGISGSITASAGASNTIAYGEGYGVGTAALTLTGGLIVNHAFNFGQVTSGQTATQTFTVTNASATANLTVRRVTSPPPFLAATTCGATLAPGAKCTVMVTYTPTNQVAAGTASPPSTNDSGALTIESDATSSPDVLNFSGQAGPVAVTSPGTPTTVATYTLSQGSLTFATTAVGNSSAVQTIAFTNTGTVALTVTALGTTADYTASSNCGTVLPGAGCTISVAATPQTTGAHVGSLEIVSNAATTLEFVSLMSSATAAPLTLTPGALTFGSTVVGVSSTLPVQVTNTGTTPVLFNGISATGDYAVAGSCLAAGGALAAGQSCTIQVTFAPTATGTRTGVLSLASSASTNPLTVALTGVGIQSKLLIAPTSLAFGSLVVGAAGSLSVTLTNSGTAPISSLVLAASGDFSVSLPCPGTLLIGASCTAQVTFTPTALGARTGVLTVTSSDPSSPVTIPLTGTGIAAGTFALTVDGGQSATVTVKSGGPASYTLTVTPAGTFAGGVALTCAAVQPAQYASCSITPAMLTLAGAPQTSIATINTITSADGSARLRRPMSSRAEKMVCLLLPGVWVLFRQRRRLRRGMPVLMAVLFGVVMVVVSGCGSQGGDFNTRYTPVGSYVYQVTGTSTSGVQMTQVVTLNLNVTAR